LLFCVIGLSTAGVVQANESSKLTQATIDHYVRDLGDPNDQVRAAAGDHLLNSYPEALPMIESAASRLAPDGLAAKSCADLLKRLRPLAAARARAEKKREGDYQWNLANALAEYDRAGHHDPKWDDLAHQAIRLYVSRVPKENSASFGLLEHVTSDLHCDDALILYLDARKLESHEPINFDPAVNTYLDAADAFTKSQYSAYRKCGGLAGCIAFTSRTTLELNNPQITPLLRKWADAALELWPKAVVEPTLSAQSANDLAQAIVKAQVHFGADRGDIVEKMFPAFDKAFPNSSMPLVFKGVGYIDYAWDARGFGFANTVAPRNFQLFADRLTMAASALEKAYAIDPSDPAAPTAMLHVELGQGRGKAVMEQWFQRATAADPMHSDPYGRERDAYEWKLEYLTPRWYGSEAQLRQFARQCAATRDTFDRVTVMPFRVQEELSRSVPDVTAYWHQPDVWLDVQPVLLQAILDDPADPENPTRYAYWASRCGQ
jgi:hypothetical protein